MHAARHYLDHAATTALRPSARSAMIDALDAANPSSVHSAGRAARAILEQAREDIAASLEVDPVEVIFTSGGTEADNLALRGLAAAAIGADRPARRILAPPTEHEAVLRTADALGLETWPVDGTGRVLLAQPGRPTLDASRHAAVAVMAANNETGAIQPLATVADAAHTAGVPLHVDAVQAAGHIAVDLSAPGVTTAALSAHKFGGPRGIGALVVRRGTDLHAQLTGGGQERGLRSGTQDVAAAAGMAAALVAATADREQEAARLGELRDRLRDGLLEQVPDLVIHTTEPALPGHLHVSVPGAEGDSLILLLDRAGIDCSTGSACNAGVARPSHVLLAMGVPEPVARGALRFTLGWSSTREDVDAVLSVAGGTVAAARAAGMA